MSTDLEKRLDGLSEDIIRYAAARAHAYGIGGEAYVLMSTALVAAVSFAKDGGNETLKSFLVIVKQYIPDIEAYIAGTAANNDSSFSPAAREQLIKNGYSIVAKFTGPRGTGKSQRAAEMRASLERAGFEVMIEECDDIDGNGPGERIYARQKKVMA